MVEASDLEQHEKPQNDPVFESSSHPAVMMRSIYTRRRNDKLSQPAWMGGLIYNDFPIHSLSRTNISPNQIFSRVVTPATSTRLSSRYSVRTTESAAAHGRASAALQTTGQDQCTHVNERNAVSASPLAKGSSIAEVATSTIMRPKTAGTLRTPGGMRGAESSTNGGAIYVQNLDTHVRPSSSRPRVDTSMIPASARKASENLLVATSHNPSNSQGAKRGPALDLTNVMAERLTSIQNNDTDRKGAQTERTHPQRRRLSDCRRSSFISVTSRRSVSPSRSMRSARRSLCASWRPPEIRTNFHVFSIKIIQLSSLAAKYSQGGERSVRIHLSMAGFIYISKPITILQQASSDVPDEKFTFEANATVNSLVLAVKVYEQNLDVTQTKRIREFTAQSTELNNGLIDLTSALETGGEHRVSCRLSCDPETGSIPELLLEVQSACRSTDFVFSYLEGSSGPIFKKAGYSISNNGILTFPQNYKKRGLPATCLWHTLKMTKCVYSAERASEEVEGLKLFRGKDGKGGNYCVKRFNVMDIQLRNMLVSELNGLISCPPTIAITPLDAFLDGLEVVLVLDDGGGFYLRDLIEIRHKLPEQNCAIVLRQVLNGLKYLHDLKIVHNDVDARNILVFPSGEVRLSGFWYCTQHVGKVACKFAGPFVHMSPERLLGLDCSFASDIWSLGILAIEMITGKGPYNMSDYVGPNALFEFKQMVVSGPSPSISRGEFSYDARLFVESCLHKNLKLRATSQALQSHFFIAKYENFGIQFLGRWVSKSKKAKPKVKQTSSWQESIDLSHQLFMKACFRAHPATKNVPAGNNSVMPTDPSVRGNSSPGPPHSETSHQHPLPSRQPLHPSHAPRRLLLQKQGGASFNAKKTIYAAFDLAYKEPRRKERKDSDDSSDEGQA